MRTYGILTAVCAVLTLGAATASAQDSAKTGLTMSSNSAIGILVPLGDKAAVRPHLRISRSTSDYEGSQFIHDSASSTTLVPGADVLFFLKSWDTTRLYVSPQYTYSRSSASRDGEDDEPEATHGGAFMVGVQHGLGARFGVYVEGGLNWTRNKSQSGLSSVTTNVWSSRATVGGILFF